MDMWYALAGINAVLHCYVEACSIVDPFDHAANSLDGKEQISHLSVSKVRKPRSDPPRGHENMARE